MHTGLIFPLALLGASCAMVSAPPLHSQTPQALTPCIQHHIQQEEMRSPKADPARSGSKAYVVKVTYDGADGLPKPVLERVTRRVEESNFDVDSDWPVYVAEVVTDAMQDNGYFKATVRPQLGVVSSGPMGEQVWVTFRVSEGPQYRLWQVQLADASVFPATELRKHVPLQDGGVFDVSKLRAGIDALTEFYGAHGFVNFVAVPEVYVDEARLRISLTLQLDEGRQFRVGSVRIVGLDQQASDALKLEIKSGMIFSNELIEDFYSQNRSVLPADASPGKDTTITQDARTHTIAILFDFRGCQKTTERPVTTGPILPRRPF